MKLSDRASSIGDGVMIGTVAAYLVASWFIADVIGPYLGYEMTTYLGLFIGLFVIHGAQLLGERVKWHIASKEESSRLSG